MKQAKGADTAIPENLHARKRTRLASLGAKAAPDLPAGGNAEKAPRYSPTADRILLTARRIVVERGIDALTFETIAMEAPVNKGATRYYFGSKDGLLAAMLDELVMPERVAPETRPVEPTDVGQRLDTVLDKIRFMLSDRESFLVFLELLPVALRNDVLHSRVQRLQAFWIEWLIEGLGFDPKTKSEKVRAIGRLCLAVIDGLGVQREIDGESAHSELVLEALRQPLSDCLAKAGQPE